MALFIAESPRQSTLALPPFGWWNMHTYRSANSSAMILLSSDQQLLETVCLWFGVSVMSMKVSLPSNSIFHVAVVSYQSSLVWKEALLMIFNFFLQSVHNH